MTKVRVKEVPCAIPERAVEILEQVARQTSRKRGEVSRMFLLHGMAAYLAGTPLESLDNPFREQEPRLTMEDLLREDPDALTTLLYKNSASVGD